MATIFAALRALYSAIRSWLLREFGSHDRRLSKSIPRKAESRVKFYEQNYDLVAEYFLQPGDKHELGTKPQKCRFCGLSSPAVTFGNEAHALPEAIGNKSITALYECDVCNDFFSRKVEDHWGKWSAPMRTMYQVRGKNGVPTLKKSDTGWRVELDKTGFVFREYVDDPITELDEINKRLVVKVPRQPYVPIGAFKTYVKMALSLMSDTDVAAIPRTLQWLMETTHTRPFAPEIARLYRTFVPGPRPFDGLAIFLFRRKSPSKPVPHLTFIIAFANECHQVFLPCPDMDSSIDGQTITLTPFPTPFDLWLPTVGPVRSFSTDLSGTAVVRNDIAQTVFHFDSVTRSG